MPREKQPAPSGLALFQHRLITLLREGKSPGEVRDALLADGALRDFHAYVKAMDLNMLEVASALVVKWGQTEETE